MAISILAGVLEDFLRAFSQALLDVLASTSVQDRLAALPGYELAMSGEVREAA